MDASQTARLTYHCLSRSGALKSGQATARFIDAGDGLLNIFMDWQWIFGDEGCGLATDIVEDEAVALEDETGLVNLIVWRQVYERFEMIAKSAAVLEVRGRIQSEQGVVNLIADELREPKLGGEVPRSRNFR